MFNKLSKLVTTTGLVTLGVAIISTRTAVKAVKGCKDVAQNCINKGTVKHNTRILNKTLSDIEDEVIASHRD